MAQQQQQRQPQGPQQQRGRMHSGSIIGSNAGGGNRERPAHVVRYGPIKAAVWRNIVDRGNASGPMYNVTFSRSYKEGDAWRDSTSFGIDDLLVVAKAADDCHSWIHEQRSRDAQAAEQL